MHNAQITLVINTTTTHAPNEGEEAFFDDVMAGNHLPVPQGAHVAVEILQPAQPMLQSGQPGLAQP